ncbi:MULTISPECIES: Asp-tRNA(Asn)/Glu-tRNA(Gln) amidotransferase subunit GatC [Kocuria]|uniref:Asp-tRNA(Asn)/Glu-tRNA(Gln) amidotransferase subunit GatC n=1 Tax=Kocuria TaxID=57493 RepID=UPI0006603EFD|nr:MULTISPECIES: Asp-tRNA(Asn)/Glu-tRNA(Gln) amidotransferase subunit GatC [Kocuria]MCT1366556.1 Asp-tRNA(Asn)/Glu-tRNA(Gln) amidotransferase subunit GatC [Rothia sp. p3-SID1597]RUQ21182.1 Asp-tRNA(Asn)/Glu-tRNA(Gln) amidotransferase subunit GatC [Kocuria sp. HSID16901]
MTAISRDQVAHLASLAHIEMDDQELDSMAAELDVIVNAVQSVQEAPIEDVPPTSHPLPLSNAFRDDVVGETLTNDEALLNAPDAEDGQFKVPAILNED